MLFSLAWCFWVLGALREGWHMREGITYFVTLAAGMAAVACAAWGVAAGAQLLAKARTGPLPRWQYAVLAVVYYVPLVITAGTPMRPDGEPFWWPGGSAAQGLAEVAAFGVICIGVLGSLMLGRAVSWGRLRDWCWLTPIPWAGRDEAWHVTLE